MKCPYCNKELGLKNECLTSSCYAFGKIFPKYDTDDKDNKSNIDNLNSNIVEIINSNETTNIVENTNNNENTKTESIPDAIQDLTYNNTDSKCTGSSSGSIDEKTSNQNIAIYIIIVVVIALILGYTFL